MKHKHSVKTKKLAQLFFVFPIFILVFQIYTCIHSHLTIQTQKQNNTKIKIIKIKKKTLGVYMYLKYWCIIYQVKKNKIVQGRWQIV